MTVTQYPEILGIDKCIGCGGITAQYENGESISMPLSEFESNYGKVNANKNKHGKTVYSWRGEAVDCKVSSCNRCVNGWSTDYCSCGSKKHFSKCHGKPYQYIPTIQDLQKCLH